MKSFLSWFRRIFTTRSVESIPMGSISADLDALLSQTTYIKFKGRAYKLPPVEVAIFTQIGILLAKLDSLRNAPTVSVEEIVNTYGDVFALATAGAIGRTDVGEMTQQQCAAFLEAVMKHITGTALPKSSPPNSEEEKKN